MKSRAYYERRFDLECSPPREFAEILRGELSDLLGLLKEWKGKVDLTTQQSKEREEIFSLFDELI